MNKPWTDKIRQRMGHYEPQAPEGLYDDIMGEMARRGLLPQGQSQHRARQLPLWVNRVAVSAIAAAAVLTGVMLWTARTDVAPSVAQGGAVPASVARGVSECAEPASAVPPSAPARLTTTATGFHAGDVRECCWVTARAYREGPAALPGRGARLCRARTPIVGGYKMDRLAHAEKGGADADDRRTFLNGHLEVVAHPHG